MIKTIRLAGIEVGSIVDGPGLRFVIFTQGCRHNCKGCFNPETHPFQGGTETDVEAVIKQIKGDPIIKGVTFSGGDCFEQAEACAYIAREVKKYGLDVWAYTGYTFESIQVNMKYRTGWEEFMRQIDVLVDGKFEIAKKDLTLQYRGSSNQRLIDAQNSLLTGAAVLFEK